MITRRSFVRFSSGVSLLGLFGTASAMSQVLGKPEVFGIADALFADPYVDIDEWRDFPVRHRYVHGGFKGNDTRFSFYFAPKEKYEGRFFHTLNPTPGDENGAQKRFPRDNPAVTQDVNTVAFAIASGAYLVESNMGSTTMYPTKDHTISGFRASAAVAQYSRVLAAEMYGPHRTYGYVFGPSGGSLHTIACIENTNGVWDGAVPYVMACDMAMPYSFTVKFHAFRLLKDKFASIVDALDPGGSGDMYAGLNGEQSAALLEATRMGFPPAAWFAHEQIAFATTAIFGSLLDNLLNYDPSYFEDFWKVPGYLGADPPASLLAARIDHSAKVVEVLSAEDADRAGRSRVTMPSVMGNTPALLRLSSLPNKDLIGTSIFIASGGAAGSRVLVAGVADDLLQISYGESNYQAVSKLRVGDEVRLDNAMYLAVQTYHRHQMPTPDYYAWDQFRGPDGSPMYPQRSPLLGPLYQDYAAGAPQTGRFNAKMIVVSSLMDEGAFPWYSDWYRTKVKRALGDRFDDNYRLWFNENALHGRVDRQADETRAIAYIGSVQQALRDLAAWVEKGVTPPASTNYRVADSQILVPATATERRGIQPVVRLQANGGALAEVAVGEPVSLVGEIELPSGTGTPVSARWDFEGSGTYPVEGEIRPANAPVTATVATAHAFAKPGTYFPTLRVRSQRHPDTSDFALIENIGRARIVVGAT